MKGIYLFLNYLVALIKAVFFVSQQSASVGSILTAESVKGAALPLQSIDHIHGGDSLPLGVLSVGDGITDDVLKEHLEDTTGLLVDEARDTLDTAAASQTPDGGLGDALDVVTQHLAMTLGASLSEPLASLATSSHVEFSDSTDDCASGSLNIYRRSNLVAGARAGT